MGQAVLGGLWLPAAGSHSFPTCSSGIGPSPSHVPQQKQPTRHDQRSAIACIAASTACAAVRRGSSVWLCSCSPRNALWVPVCSPSCLSLAPGAPVASRLAQAGQQLVGVLLCRTATGRCPFQTPKDQAHSTTSLQQVIVSNWTAALQAMQPSVQWRRQPRRSSLDRGSGGQQQWLALGHCCWDHQGEWLHVCVQA